MIASKDFVSRDVYFYNAFNDKKDFELYPQIPFVAYQVILGYKLFGDNLWFPRLVNIMLMLFSIVVIFYTVRIFLKNDLYGIAAALLLGIMPLGVYFSRNLQPEIGAFFFMMSGNLLFIKFTGKFKIKYLIAFAFCLFMILGYKCAFLFGIIPLFLIFPYKKYFSGRNLKSILGELSILISPVVTFFIYNIIVKQISFAASVNGRFKILEIFTMTYWLRNGAGIWQYITRENFTIIYFFIFTAGVVKLWLDYKKDKTLFAKYLRAWSIIVVPYFAFFSDYVNQHNYYQMPFLGFVCLTVVYFIKEISFYVENLVSGKFKAPVIFTVIFTASVLGAYPMISSGIKGHFNYLLLGTDEVGKILKTLMPDKQEKFFIYTFPQGYAPCVYAERKCGWSNSLEEFKSDEQRFGIQYIAIIPFSYFNNMEMDVKNYVAENYHVKFIGLVGSRDALRPTAMVLQKGGKLDIQRFFNSNRNVELRTVYNTLMGQIPFYILSDGVEK
jgi:hypothetical protein